MKILGRILSIHIVCVFFLFAGCESIFFYPMKEMVLDPASIGMAYRSHKIPVNEEEDIFIWELFPKGKEKGTVLFFHGNAENISTHIASVAWLPEKGYRVFLSDYRGFGGSDGKATVKNAVHDIKSVIDWVSLKEDTTTLPLILFSQSIGASLSLFALSDPAYKKVFDGVIFDSPFSSYRTIAREKIQDTIILYPLAWPLSLLFTSCCSPLEGARNLIGIPVRVIGVEDDSIVGVHHARAVFKEIPGDLKELWTEESGGHISFVRKNDNRLKILEFINSLREE
jgi:pimeloyl-ACP methyl ester carboxylesterase